MRFAFWRRPLERPEALAALDDIDEALDRTRQAVALVRTVVREIR